MVKFSPIATLRGRTYRLGNPSRFGGSTRKALAARKSVKPRLGSKTKTIVERKRKQQSSRPLQNPGGIVTQSYHSAYRKPTLSAFVRKQVSSPDYYVTNVANSFAALSGFQGFNMFQLARREDMNAILGSMPAQVPAGNATRRFLLQKILSNAVYTNASSASCTLDIYDCAVKFDNDLSPTAAWTNGIAMETTLPAGTPPVSVLGIKPWQSQQFKSFFKIIKTTHVNLAAGASHKHNISLTPNQLLKEQYIAENLNYAGLTYLCVVVVKGVPVCDSDDVPRLVSTAPIQIDTVREMSYKFSWVSNIDTDLTIANNMVTLIQPEAMNVFQGQATAVSKAE